MIKIAFIDDDLEQHKIYDDYMEKFQKENGTEFKVSKFYDGSEIVRDNMSGYDILVLDVQMKDLNGIDTAHYIRKLDKNVVIIFATNMQQYAVKGYAVNALDYLLKPVTYFAFSKRLQDAVEIINNRKSSFLLLNTEKGICKVDASLILYIESMKHKVKIITETEEYIMTNTIKRLEEELKDNKGFFRCNSCYLVNMAHVNKINENFAQVGKHSLAISRPKKKAFLQALAEYIGGVI